MKSVEINIGRLRANGLWNHFTKRKKYMVVCGNCDHTFTEKVPFLTDKASAICPACATQNTWRHSDWQEAYRQMAGA